MKSASTYKFFNAIILDNSQSVKVGCDALPDAHHLQFAYTPETPNSSPSETVYMYFEKALAGMVFRF